MQKTILIVDDEETIRQSLGGILVDEGYEILMAENGEQAIKVVEDELPESRVSGHLATRDGWPGNPQGDQV